MVTEDIETSDDNDANLIGAFEGYIRRPKPSESGMVAQFFGENGNDADTLCALSLTKFQNVTVHIDVYIVKDPRGALVRGDDGKHPLIASFEARTRRPVPMAEGMMAQFFASNGEDADQVVDLGKTSLLDAFVFVQIMKTRTLPKGSFNPEVEKSLEKAASRKTIAEKKDLKTFAKSWDKAARKLEMSGFLRSHTVHAVLGTEQDFSDWLKGSKCCAPGSSPCLHEGTPVAIPGARSFAMVPLCQEHAALGIDGLPGGKQVLASRQAILVQRWAWDKLCSIVGLEEGVPDPNPALVYQWAVQNKIDSLLPKDYLHGRH